MTLPEFLSARIAEDMADSWAKSGLRAEAFTATRAWRGCEAKRRIVELHSSTQGKAWCRSCGRADLPNGAHEWPCSTILALAAVYADHPDYRPEWKP